MYLYFTPKNIIIFIILAAISFATGGLGGLLWYALISFVVIGFSLAYDYFEWKIKFSFGKKKNEEIKPKTKKTRKNHHLKVIKGGKG